MFLICVCVCALSIVAVVLPNGEIDAEREEIVASVRATDIPIFERTFFENWAVVEKAIKYSTASPEAAFFEFTNTEYYPLLKSVTEQTGKTFTPKYPPEDGDAAPDVVEQRRKYLAILTSASAETVDSEMRARWQEVLRASPTHVRTCMDNEASYGIFERETYYEIVAQVAKSTNPAPTWCYKPLLVPETEIDKAAVAKVTETTAEVIAHNVLQAWEAEVKQIPVSSELRSSRCVRIEVTEMCQN